MIDKSILFKAAWAAAKEWKASFIGANCPQTVKDRFAMELRMQWCLANMGAGPALSREAIAARKAKQQARREIVREFQPHLDAKGHVQMRILRKSGFRAYDRPRDFHGLSAR